MEGFQSYRPDPGDEEHYRRFARAYYGARAIGAPDILAHSVTGWIDLGAEPDEQYRQAVLTFRARCADAKLPHDPYYTVGYKAPPVPPTERDAKILFHDEYRRKYPGQRVNSRHANQLWKEKAILAHQIVEDRYKIDQEHYEREELARAEANAARHAAWLDAVHGMALLENWARGLQGA
jgi:hypothetical protein